MVIPHIEVLKPNEAEDARRNLPEAVIVQVESNQGRELAELVRQLTELVVAARENSDVVIRKSLRG